MTKEERRRARRRRITFGQRIRELRKAKRYSLKELARLTGIEYTYLSKIENDHRIPPVDVIRELADALDGSLSELLELSKELPADILRRVVSEQMASAVATLARSTGVDATEEDETEALVAEMPQELLQAIRILFRVTQGDITGIARILRALGNSEEKQRERIIQRVAELVEEIAA